MKDSVFQPVILRFDSIDSTNTEALRQSELGAPEGLCIVAREQTKGRGRGSHVWVSKKDAGLYFSIILHPSLEMRYWPLITFMAALSITDVLNDTYNLMTDIKWPNDVLIKKRKISGILAETVEVKNKRACVLGIGVNLTRQEFPSYLIDAATSIEQETGMRPDKEEVLQNLIKSIKIRYQQLHMKDGVQKTLNDWTARSSYAYGKLLRVQLFSETFQGITRGIETDGALRIETTEAEMKIIRAGEITALEHLDVQVS
jgi:BirA family transcriptional regulator, biotin operon repressor / biotin---[acetyl-CoA-carboxylase] ligase